MVNTGFHPKFSVPISPLSCLFFLVPCFFFFSFFGQSHCVETPSEAQTGEQEVRARSASACLSDCNRRNEAENNIIIMYYELRLCPFTVSHSYICIIHIFMCMMYMYLHVFVCTCTCMVQVHVLYICICVYVPIYLGLGHF